MRPFAFPLAVASARWKRRGEARATTSQGLGDRSFLQQSVNRIVRKRQTNFLFVRKGFLP